jgi:hypothetical protein
MNTRGDGDAIMPCQVTMTSIREKKLVQESIKGGKKHKNKNFCPPIVWSLVDIFFVCSITTG